MPGTLAPDHVVPLLRGRFGRPFLYATSCPSTQRLLDEHHDEGAVAVCEEQTAGRGRLGRSWEAAPGTSILCSILLRPPPARVLPQLALVGGLAVAETVEQTTGRSSAIKWPNDVLLEGGKVAGVLADARERIVVLGIGLNVNQRPDQLPERPRVPAVSLRAVDGLERERAPILADLLERLERHYDAWLADGLSALHGAIVGRDSLRGRRVEIGELRGIGAGIDAEGRLQLETVGGRRVVASGEVTLDGAAG